MITANIAGSSGPHVRHDRHDRESSYSSSDLEEIERKHHRQNGDPNGGQIDPEQTEADQQAMEDEIKRIRKLIIEHRRKRFCKDYKTWAYLLCVAGIVVGAIVLVILAGMGYISDRH